MYLNVNILSWNWGDNFFLTLSVALIIAITAFLFRIIIKPKILLSNKFKKDNLEENSQWKYSIEFKNNSSFRICDVKIDLFLVKRKTNCTIYLTETRNDRRGKEILDKKRIEFFPKSEHIYCIKEKKSIIIYTNEELTELLNEDIFLAVEMFAKCCFSGGETYILEYYYKDKDDISKFNEKQSTIR
jgi:hypothetical protein